MDYITNGVLKNGATIGKAKVESTNLLTKGRMIPYNYFNATSITVHETDCPNVPAKNFYLAVQNGQKDTTFKPASYHLCIDAYTIRQLVNLNRTCYHAGCNEGNNTSIGIEICQYSNNRSLQEQTYKNVAEVIKILKEEVPSVKKVVRHYDWTRKNCPSYLLNQKYKGLTWNWFTSLLTEKHTQLKNGGYNKIYKVICNCLNVRQGRPDEDGNLAPKLFEMKYGEEFLLGYVLNGWASIWVEGDFGYINTSSQYIEEK